MTWKAFPEDSKGFDVWNEWIEDSDTKYFFLEGAVRSSKTFASVLAWCDWVENVAPKGPLIMMGNTRETLIQNVINPMMDLVPAKHIKLNRGIGNLTLFGREIYLFGASNIAAMRKLQGKGAVGAYCDEAPTYPKDVWQMLGTRTAAEGIKIIATMNPDSPACYMKKDYLDRLKAVNGRAWHFTLNDNPFLSEKVKNELKAQYTGLWKLRYIDGLWVQAEGAIYPDYQKAVVSDLPDPKRFDAYIVTCDYGSTNPFCYLLLGRCEGVWYAMKEFYYDSAKKGQRVNKQHSDELATFLGGILPKAVDVDPSALAFITELRNNYPFLENRGIISQAINAVLPGIQATAQMMYQGKLKISDSCEHLITELAGYVWDTKKTEQGEDAPIKVNDHLADCLRYSVNRIQWDGY